MGKSVKVHASLENAVSDYKLDFITALPNFENTALSSHTKFATSACCNTTCKGIRHTSETKDTFPVDHINKLNKIKFCSFNTQTFFFPMLL